MRGRPGHRRRSEPRGLRRDHGPRRVESRAARRVGARVLARCRPPHSVARSRQTSARAPRGARQGGMTMHRRTILKALSGAAIGSALGRRAAWAQAPVKGGIDSRGAAPLGAVPRDIKIGMSAAFRGPSASLGTELYRGAQAYYAEINLRGGVHGRTISVVALD